jgi:hypothetical protein
MAEPGESFSFFLAFPGPSSLFLPYSSTQELPGLVSFSLVLALLPNLGAN